jgi:hypothetical protein
VVSIYGFTLLRNGVTYDYSFKESLASLSAVTKKIALALGDSDDDTGEQLASMDSLDIVPTVWDMSNRQGGIILSEQTNIALNRLRELAANDQHAWGIYLQCDEVFHQDDYQRIINDIKEADAKGFDAVKFRYFHFWQDHHQIAINKKWYPLEVRAIKLSSPIESWGDAQGFRNFKSAFESEAAIYHYGHVREIDHYARKKRDMLKLYHDDSRIAKYRRRERRFDNQTEVLPFWGSHPAVMQERILRLGDQWESEPVELVEIVGDEKLCDPDFSKRVIAAQVRWIKSAKERTKGSCLVFLTPSWWDRLRYPSNVPLAMRSKLATPWSLETVLTLRLSEQGIGVKAVIDQI